MESRPLAGTAGATCCLGRNVLFPVLVEGKVEVEKDGVVESDLDARERACDFCSFMAFSTAAVTDWLTASAIVFVRLCKIAFVMASASICSVLISSSRGVFDFATAISLLGCLRSTSYDEPEYKWLLDCFPSLLIDSVGAVGLGLRLLLGAKDVVFGKAVFPAGATDLL